jgi:hypothetical protein
MTKYRNILLILLIVTLAVLVFLIFNKKPQIHSSTIQSSPQIKSSPTTNESAKINISSPNNSPTGNSPVAPYGNFISNHHPNIGGKPYPSSEVSTCITTIGASCSITFRKSSITKTLQSQKVDSQGVATWIWDVQKEGFAAGEWSITVTAQLNDKLSTVSDKNNLIVSK